MIATKKNHDLTGHSFRDSIERISNQLCDVVDETFHFRIIERSEDESIQKLSMLINFLLGSAECAIDELRTRESRINAILETVLDGIITIDAKGVIQSVNSAAAKMFVYRKEELEGSNISILMPLPHSENHDRYLSQLQRAEKSNIIGEYRELIGKRKNGTCFPIEIAVNRIEKSHPVLFTGIVRDLTERKRAEMQLRTSESRFRELFESMNAAVLLVKHDQIVECNNAALDIFRCSKQELTRSSLWDFFNAEKPDHTTLKTDILREIRRKEKEHYEWNLLRKDGKEIPVAVFLKLPKIDDDETIQVIVWDISKRKQVEKKVREKEEQLYRAQRLETVGQLTAGIAHEFNNLIHCISGFTKFAIDESKENPAVVADLKQVVKAADRAAELTKQLRSYSRQEVLQKKWIEPNVLLEEIARMLDPLFRAQIDVSFRPGQGISQIFADSSLLQQVILNLCINARDALPEKGVICISTAMETIHQKTAEDDFEFVPGEYVAITVADNGTGIPDKIKEFVFDPFFTTKDVGKGSGLGLSMAHGVIKQHCGRISVEDNPGGGSIFKILLPCIPCDEQSDEIIAGSET